MAGVSAFIAGTCRIRPKPTEEVFVTAQYTCKTVRDKIHSNVFRCGSAVEFYIEPIHPYIDDIDYMFFIASQLVFTEDIPVLPADYSLLADDIDCLQMVPYNDYPGFVKLLLFGKVNYNWHCRQFEFQHANGLRLRLIDVNDLPTELRSIRPAMEYKATGPAVKMQVQQHPVFDMVLCYWCPQWPNEAKDWPFRRRNYGWPTTENIRKIVENGCHVVHAKHPACRDDMYQCRLSFSTAEIILIQSWSTTQQIVYHMLRFFAKKELIKKDCRKEDEVLCTYHFKTLMLWSCEEKSPEWWKSNSVIQLCRCLLRKLSKWLNKGYCQNYFIPQANLFHECMNQKTVYETTKHLNEFCQFFTLYSWLELSYILPILWKLFRPALENVMEMLADLGYWMLRTCEEIDVNKVEDFDEQFSFVFGSCANYIFSDVRVEISCDVRYFLTIASSFSYAMNFGSKIISKKDLFPSTATAGYTKFSSCFPQFVKVLFSVYVADALRFNQITCDNEFFTDFIRNVTWQPNVVKSRYHNFPKQSKTDLDRRVVLFLNAQSLMENLTGLNSLQEFKLISRLSIELLRKALQCDDLKSRAFRDAAFVYMATMYFTESNYEATIDLCSRVFISQASDDVCEEEKMEDEREMLNAGCLLHVDDVVRFIGFYLLFRRIRYNFQYNKRQYFLDLRLTPEVFSHYLIVSSYYKGWRRTKQPHCGLKAPSTCIHPLDKILMIATDRKSSIMSKKAESVVCVYERTNPTNQLEVVCKCSVSNEDHITQLLMEYSLDNMTSLYSSIGKHFDIQSNIVNCYRAAYLYKCRQYPEVMNLCGLILNEPDLNRDAERLEFANVTVLPPLDSYFDSDIRCLLGFHTLVCDLSPSNGEGLPIKTEDNCNPPKFKIPSKVLALVSFDKYRYFVGRHFLARYLKVRCLIDCNHSITEVMCEVQKLKSKRPFEHLVRSFIQYKFRQFKTSNRLTEMLACNFVNNITE